MNAETKDATEKDLHRPPETAEPEARRGRFTWKMRIALILFGTVLGLVILEIFLRALGFVYYHEREHTAADHPADAFVILCIGDSCTYGQGSGNAMRYGYPAQLETILRTRHPDREFRVVNMGFPGANSSQVVRRFEGWLQLKQPDLAIVLVGNNDVWNQNESFIHLVGRGEEATFSRRLATRLRIWGDSLRVVRLARCIAVSLDDDREEALEWNPDEDTNPSDGHFREGREILGDIERVQELYRMNFQRLSRIAEDHGVEMLWLDYHLPAKFGETDYIDPVLEDLDAPYVDLAPHFRYNDEVRWELIAGDKWHPNHLGYALFARIVYNKLVDLGYAPGPPLKNIESNIAVHN